MDLTFNTHEDANRRLWSQVQQQLNTIYQGGGKSKIKKQHEQGKKTARERLDALFDSNSKRFEMGAFAGFEMYAQHGGCPAGGVIVELGYVHGQLCIAVANDATVKAGAWFPITGKKNLRAQEIALENRIPIIYLVDSAGVYLPLQDEIFPDKEHFGRIFRNNARLSSAGVIQIAAIMGSCVAGGAYLPIMSDEAMIVDKTGSIFLAGSYLVKAAIGEDVDNESLGGASTHCEISGVTDYKCADDLSCIERIRSIIHKIGRSETAGFNRIEPLIPEVSADSIFGLLPDSRDKQYNMHSILKCIVDQGSIDEYKASFGQSIICAYARIDGWAVGIVANQRNVVKARKSKGQEMQFGGVIYSDSADKAARFIMNCNQKKIPLVFFQDATGFMVGSRSEHGGIIKDGAKLVNAMANSVVPKFTVIIGNSYGAANYAMCGKAYDPRLIVGWPSAQIAVMGGAQAAKVLLQIEIASLKSQGKTLQPKEEEALLQRIKEKYDAQSTAYYAAARLWIDAIINPTETRSILSMGIQMSNHAPITAPYNVGVIQT